MPVPDRRTDEYHGNSATIRSTNASCAKKKPRLTRLNFDSVYSPQSRICTVISGSDMLKRASMSNLTHIWSGCTHFKMYYITLILLL